MTRLPEAVETLGNQSSSARGTALKAKLHVHRGHTREAPCGKAAPGAREGPWEEDVPTPQETGTPHAPNPPPTPTLPALWELLIPIMGPTSESREAVLGKAGPTLPRAILKDYLRSCSQELL